MIQRLFRVSIIVFSVGIFVFHLQSAQAKAVPDDKAVHFSVAATAQTGCSAVGYALTRSKWATNVACFLVVNTAGAVKEAVDPYQGGTRDETDIYANLAGSGLSFMTVSFAF
ncbi:MAG: hypothetical protein COV44_00805 [Deltaproteobacteria bacterium CG11_big_fil_rev_8_21_14_0_20_45_16]|nr:MAG: hypothetical protein COV44_00805 [Deltaproteobacteria bacterium CG11_big_fil_rev_8_21_14_0_20_45_16]